MYMYCICQLFQANSTTKRLLNDSRILNAVWSLSNLASKYILITLKGQFLNHRNDSVVTVSRYRHTLVCLTVRPIFHSKIRPLTLQSLTVRPI